MRRFTLLLVSLLFIGAVNAQLVVNIGDDEICAGDTTYITASGVDIYNWTSTKLDTTGGDSVNFRTAISDGGSFAITLEGIDSTLDDTTTLVFNIQVNGLPVINIISSAAGSNNFVCIGNSATLTASGSASVETYSWSPSATLDNDTAMVVVATPTTATNYTVTVTDTNGCMRVSPVKPVNVNIANPIIGLTASDTTICPGVDVTLSASSASATFEWGPGATLSTTIGSIVTATPTTTTSYTVTATANGCDTFRSITVNVLPVPSLSYSINPSGSICLDETAFIDLDCSGCVSYTWSFPNSSFNTLSDTVTVSPNSSGLVQVTVSGFGTNGCAVKEVIPIQVDSCFLGTPFGISEAEGKQSFVFLAGSSLMIQSEVRIDEVSLFNLAGQQLIQSQFTGNNAQLSATELEQGIYIVTVRSGDSIESHKVMVVR